MADTTMAMDASSCLGRPCMTWSDDGEWEAMDLDMVLKRLAKVDLDVAALRQHTVSREACPSIN
jgi:hypothetical protein